ncbi:hypothetical protein HDU82_008632, partial [Entophlyctis luteolus]
TPSLTAIPGNGYHRLHRKFALVFKFHDSCTFKVPFREKSKDSKFSDESLKSEMKLAQYDSVLAFDIPMVTAATGYVTTLSARFKSVVLTSSLNSWEVLLECQMKSPLKWNGERVWEYNIEVSKGKLHYLQDHIQLLKDVFSDISYSTVPHIGPYFIPIAYQLSISVIDIDLYCCINRQNVQSNKLEENSFFIASFPSGRVTVNLPFLLAEPLVYGFTFHFQTENASLSISHPGSHVIGAFMTESSRNIGSFQSLVIKGNYEYFATQPAIGPDSTNITIEVDSAAIKAYGFTITAFFDFLANYFGEFSNVMNVEEYRLKVSDPDKFKAQRENKIMDSTDIVNDSELWIEVVARDSFVVLPENLFECVSASILHTELISLEMASNMTDMLMKVDADSIICTRTIKMPSLFDVASIRSTFDLARDNEKNAMNIQGLDVCLRRLYGPKPDFLVYASEVAITINLIEGEVSPGFLGGIQTSLKMILHHTTDADNSLPEDSTEPIQYLKVKLKKLLVHVWCKDAVIVCEMPLGAKLQSDSLVTSRWISRILVDVPAVTIKLLEESFEAWEEVFNLSLPLSACILASTDDLRAKKLEQRSFVSAQDHTLRCKHLLHRNHEPTPPFFNIPIDFKFDEDMNDALLESPSQIHRQFGKNVVGIPQFKLFRAAFDAFPKNSVISDFLCCDLKLQGDFEEATSNHPGSIALNLQSQSYETIATKESAEVFLNAFATWTAAWNAAYGSAIMFLEKAQRKVQDLIEVVVQESLNRSIFGDALFLTDPSVIWLEGRDFRKHQKDAGWKFLMRQRYCAMKIGHTALENALLRFANQFPNKRNLLQDVLPQIKKWAGFRDERADSAKNVLLSFIFTSKNVDETWEFTRFLSQHNISAFGTVEATKFSTFEVGNGENILEVNPFLLDFNATSRQDDHKPNSSFADISVFMSSSHAKFSLVPDIFGWLRIFDRFQNGMKSNSNSQIYTDIDFESAIPTNFAVMFSLVLENVSVLANAGSLIMKTEFSELSANGNYFNTSGLCDTGENMKVFGNVVGRSVKCEFIDSSNANLTNLLHLSINSIICNVINNTTLFGFGEIEVILPKSLIKLQQFFEHWRDSVPDLDFAVNAVKASLEKHSSGAAAPISRKLYTFSSFQFVVNRLILVSDLLQSFRCEYTASKLILLAKTNPVNRERNVLGRIGSHKIEFFVPDSTSANRSFYALPEAIFEFDITFADVLGPTVDGSLFLGIFGGVFDVNLLEQMMNFRSRVFSEINEILDSNAFSPQSLLRKNPKTVQRKNFSYKLKIKIAGADVTGLGPESKFLLSSDLFTVDVTNWSSDEKKINDLLEELRWKFSLEDCSLSLITNSAETSKIRATLSVENGGGSFIGERGEEEILVNVKEVNGVLHPEFPSKIISFLVHYSTRLSDDHLMASQEVFILRRNAKKLVSSVPIAGEKDRDFLRDNALEVQIGHIGIAFPFSNDAMSRSSALLLCIEKVKYESFRFQENQGVIESASLQFVEQFDPETEKSFRATNYSVTNRFLLRRINGTVFQNFTEGYGTVKVDAGVDGFDLELNSRIASHVNDLIAIYSKQRDVFGTSTASSTLLKPSQQFSMPQAFTEFVLNADLIIGPGKCSINSASSEAGVQEDESSKIQEESFEQQIFRFPRLSLSVNGTTIFGDDSKAASRVKRSVYITQHIFESENVLHPSLVSFFLNVASTINLDNFSSPMVTADVPSVSNFETQKHDVTYLLKLSQTKVSLSCLPESKVSLNCALEEANLLVTFDPSAENSGMNSINVTFNMKDANGVLRHTFSPEDCFRLSVSDLSLAGSIMFSGESRNYLLALNSSDVSAALNVRQLHDLFLFQRLWVSPLVPKTVSQQSVDSSETYAALLRLPGHSTSNGKFHDTFHLRALLPSISLSADMGHSIGKASFVISDFFTGISLSWSNESFGAKRLSTSMSNIRLYGDGRYSGEAIVVNPGFWVVSTNDFDTKTEGTISSGLFAAEKIEVQLQFQYERVLVVNIQPADFMFSQSWIDYDGDSTLCTNLIIDIESMKGILSRRTLPTLIQLIEKIKIVIAEKMNLDLSYSPETPRASRAQTSVSLRPSNSEYSLQADTLFRRVLWYKDGAKNIGRARINIKSSLVNFMRYNFRDPDFAKMVAKEIVISLSHFAQQEALLEEKLEVDLGGIAIKKGTSRSLTPEEERVWTPPEWFTFLGSSPSKNVAVIPAVSVTLNYLSDFLANKVQLGGSTFFASQIDIALNFGLYKFLLELFEFYDSAFKKSGLNLQSLPDREETDSRAQVDIEYETIGFRFDPQLKVTGEATPKELIEWLGVNKTRIPEMLYLNLCEKLSNLIVWVARNN